MLDQRNSLCKGPEAGGNGLLRNSKPQVSVAQIPDQGESGEVEWAKPFRPCSSGHEVAWADSHLGFFFLVGPCLGCGAQALKLWHMGFICLWPVGSYCPDLGSNPCPLHWKADS